VAESRITQETVEALAAAGSNVRVTQEAVEAITTSNAHYARVSQLAVEVLIPARIIRWVPKIIRYR
jgi:hypothetical protein